MSTIETRPLSPYGYILYKEVYRNTPVYMSYSCSLHHLAIHAIRSSFLLHFLFLHHSRRSVFTVFTSQLCNMIVFAVRSIGTLFGRSIVLSMLKMPAQKRRPVLFRQSVQPMSLVLTSNCRHELGATNTFNVS